jgi:hypothetical protein
MRNNPGFASSGMASKLRLRSRSTGWRTFLGDAEITCASLAEQAAHQLAWRSTCYLSEELGHAFMTLTDEATGLYLCSTPYAPGAEYGIPLGPAP